MPLDKFLSIERLGRVGKRQKGLQLLQLAGAFMRLDYIAVIVHRITA
jgi:hypothetical protein